MEKAQVDASAKQKRRLFGCHSGALVSPDFVLQGLRHALDGDRALRAHRRERLSHLLVEQRVLRPHLPEEHAAIVPSRVLVPLAHDVERELTLPVGSKIVALRQLKKFGEMFF